MFTEEFNRTFACFGDRITCQVGAFTVIAHLEHDQHSGSPDKEQDGFWPSQDPKDAGYVGEGVSDEEFQARWKHAERVLHLWKADEWYWVGVVLRVMVDEVEICDHASSLWGIEMNWPRQDGSVDNSYLTEVANELLNEALECARQRWEDACGKMRVAAMNEATRLAGEAG